MHSEYTMPTAYEISRYWRDFGILNNKIVPLPKKGESCVSVDWFLLDWSEPSCWGCRTPFISPHKHELNIVPKNKVESLGRRIWNEVPLQRCHIVPRQFGGSNHPSNLFLLCPHCHDSSPDTHDPEVFFNWIKYRPDEYREEVANKITQLKRECLKYGISSEVDQLLIQYLITYETLPEVCARFFEDSATYEVFKVIWETEYAELPKYKYGIHRYQAKEKTGVKFTTIVGVIAPLYLKIASHFDIKDPVLSL